MQFSNPEIARFISFLEKKDYKETLTALRNLREGIFSVLKPEIESELLFIEAISLLGSDKKDEALKTLSIAENIKNKVEDTYLRKRLEILHSRLQLKMGDIEKAKKIFAESKNINTGFSAPHLEIESAITQTEIAYKDFLKKNISLPTLVEILEKLQNLLLKYKSLIKDDQYQIYNSSHPLGFIIKVLSSDEKYNEKIWEILEKYDKNSFMEKHPKDFYAFLPLNAIKSLLSAREKIREESRNLAESFLAFHPFSRYLVQNSPSPAESSSSDISAIYLRLDKYKKEYAQEEEKLINFAPPGILSRELSSAFLSLHIDEDSALLRCCSQDKCAGIIIKTKKGIKLISTTYRKEEIKTLLNFLLKHLRDSENTDEESWKERTHKLYKKFIYPLEKELTGIKKLYIIPDKTFLHFPFQALWDGERYIAERFFVTYLPHEFPLWDGFRQGNLLTQLSAENFFTPPSHKRVAPFLALQNPPDEYFIFSRFIWGSRLILFNIGDDNENRLKHFVNSFMDKIKFYDAVTSLTQIQREMLKESRTRHPSYWASMLIYGDFIPLKPLESPYFIHTELFEEQIQLHTQNQKLLAPILLHEGVLFTGGEDQCITARNGFNGAILWKYPLANWMNHCPVPDGRRLFIGGMDKQIQSLDKKTGLREWSVSTGGWIEGDIIFDDNFIYGVSRDGNLYVIQKSGGKVETTLEVSHPAGSILGLSHDNIIYINGVGSLFAFKKGNYRLKWSKERHRDLPPMSVILDDYCIINDKEDEIIAVGVNAGRTEWKYKFDDNIKYIHKIDGKNFLLLGMEGIVSYFSLPGTKPRWTAQIPSSPSCPPTLMGNRLLVAGEDANIYLLELIAGSITDTIKTGIISVRGMAFYRDSLYIMDPHKGIFRLFNPDPQEADLPLSSPPASTGFFLTPFDFMGEIDITQDEEGKGISLEVNKTRSSSENRAFSLMEPVVINSSILLSQENGSLYALNVRNKSVLWHALLEDRVIHRPAWEKDKVAVPTRNGFLYLIELAGGKILHSVKTEIAFTSPPALEGNNLFIGGSQGKLYAFSMESGSIGWNCKIGGTVYSSPMIWGPKIIVTTLEGDVACVHKNTGRILWQFQTISSFRKDGVIMGNRIFLAGENGTVYCYDLSEGRSLWKQTIKGAKFTGKLTLYRERLLIGDERGKIYSLDPTSGTTGLLKTESSQDIIFTQSVGELLIQVSSTGNVHFYDPYKKSVIKEVSYQERIYHALPVSTPEEHFLVCIQEKGKLKILSIEKIQEEVRGENEEKEKKSYLTTLDDDQLPDNAIVEGVKNEEADNNIARILPYILPLGLVMTGIAGLAGHNPFLTNLGLVGGALSFILLILYNIYSENTRMKKILHRFLPSSFRERVNDVSKTEETELSAMFQDLYNYTTISETLPPRMLYALLKEVDDITNKCATRYGGEIMSYLGDAQMIIFADNQMKDDYANRAVKTAVEINKQIQKLGEKWKKEKGPAFPFELKMGFGINSGKGVIGFRGGDNKLEPFVIGDAINVAARIQSLTRKTENNILVCANTAQRLKGNYILKDLGYARLKGKAVPVRVYAVKPPDTAIEPGESAKEEQKSRIPTDFNRKRVPA